ncbi:Protein eva-1 -like protein B [Collichthys lucidus]|uniref:Protein eva-1-like protein B n=1 Tax=Collichthys lucidus TaxID=240159 RepID=A0A4U5V750_COLLU|nr:Protein eva-1 -like protein B [Collichthys lucidus]
MDVKKKEMDLLSNSIAAYAHIKANPESFGLYFVLGVCFGLVLTLCLLVIRISCKPRTNVAPSTPEKKHLKDISEEEEEESEDDEDEDVEDVEAPVVLPSHRNPCRQSDGTLSVNVFTSAEELGAGSSDWRRGNVSYVRSGGMVSLISWDQEQGLLEECITTKKHKALRETITFPYYIPLFEVLCLGMATKEPDVAEAKKVLTVPFIVCGTLQRNGPHIVDST